MTLKILIASLVATFATTICWLGFAFVTQQPTPKITNSAAGIYFDEAGNNLAGPMAGLSEYTHVGSGIPDGQVAGRLAGKCETKPRIRTV